MRVPNEVLWKFWFFRCNCSQGGQALEAAKIGLSRLGVKQRLGVLREKNILRVNYPIVIHRFFPGFCPCPLKNLLVRGVNGYTAISSVMRFPGAERFPFRFSAIPNMSAHCCQSGAFSWPCAFRTTIGICCQRWRPCITFWALTSNNKLDRRCLRCSASATPTSSTGAS